MKKVNLLHATLYGMLCAFLAIISMFYLPTSFGLTLTFFATISATLCVTELGLPIRSYLLWAVVLHFGYLLIIVMPGINVVSHKTAVLFGAIVSLFVLFSGLMISVVKAKKFKNNTTIICIFILGISLFMTSCNQTQSKQFCSELSQGCEISKDFVMIKVIQNNGSALDVYGRPLQQQKWYMYATQPGTIIDFEWNDNAKCVTPQDLDVLVSGKEPISILYKCKKLKVDTITNFPVYSYNPNHTSAVSQVITKVALLQTRSTHKNERGRSIWFQ